MRFFNAKQFLIIVSVFMLSSCATTLRIEPNEENDSLVIGQEFEYDEIEHILLKKYPNSIWNIYCWDSVIFKYN